MTTMGRLFNFTIRKVKSDNQIQGLNIGSPVLIDKLCGYAGDIVFIIKDCNGLASTLGHVVSALFY